VQYTQYSVIPIDYELGSMHHPCLACFDLLPTDILSTPVPGYILHTHQPPALVLAPSKYTTLSSGRPCKVVLCATAESPEMEQPVALAELMLHCVRESFSPEVANKFSVAALSVAEEGSGVSGACIASTALISSVQVVLVSPAKHIPIMPLSGLGSLCLGQGEVSVAQTETVRTC
jgi:hypothetical protein